MGAGTGSDGWGGTGPEGSGLTRYLLAQCQASRTFQKPGCHWLAEQQRLGWAEGHPWGKELSDLPTGVTVSPLGQ